MPAIKIGQAKVKSVSYAASRPEEYHGQLLVLTATPVELNSVLQLLRAPKRSRAVLKVHLGKNTYYLGRYGKQLAIVTMCGTGALGRDAVIIATTEAIGSFNPKAIIMVGVAFGKGGGKQNLGDVLVASQVISYEQQRVGDAEVVMRGPIGETGPTLLNRFRQALDWHFSDHGHAMQMHIGPILSGEKRVDQHLFKKDLFKKYPQAIGGEMEGAGLYAVASRAKVEWIVVKGICDWADGTKNDDAQTLAATSAASLVLHVVQDGTALSALDE